MTRREAAVGWAAAVVMTSLFCGLGVWQLWRMQYKAALLTQAERVGRAKAVVALAAAADPARMRNYDWAAGRGRFADLPPVRLDNQPRRKQAGMRVYRLFLPERGRPLLVELGWQPLGRTRARPPPVAAIPRGQVRVAGLLAPPPSRGLAAAALETAADGSLIVTGLDAPELPGALHQARLPPRILRLDPALPFGHARDLEILPNTLSPERHLGYAVQWFGLAATVLVVALLLTFRHVRPMSRR